MYRLTAVYGGLDGGTLLDGVKSQLDWSRQAAVYAVRLITDMETTQPDQAAQATTSPVVVPPGKE